MVLEKWSSVLNLYCQLSPRLKVTKYFRIGSNCPICVAYLNVLWLFFSKKKQDKKGRKLKKLIHPLSCHYFIRVGERTAPVIWERLSKN